MFKAGAVLVKWTSRGLQINVLEANDGKEYSNY
jgi:hypothetical protein